MRDDLLNEFRFGSTVETFALRAPRPFVDGDAVVADAQQRFYCSARGPAAVTGDRFWTQLGSG